MAERTRHEYALDFAHANGALSALQSARSAVMQQLSKAPAGTTTTEAYAHVLALLNAMVDGATQTKEVSHAMWLASVRPEGANDV